jgi:hypothetical protein
MSGKKHKKVVLAAIALLMLWLIVWLHHGPLASPNASVTLVSSELLPAPAPGQEFDFLLGDWQLQVTPKVSSLVVLIHGAPRLLGRWRAQREGDVRSIRDQLRIFDRSGNPISEMLSQRRYQRERQLWTVQSQDQARQRQSTGSARWHEHRLEVLSQARDGNGQTSEVRSYFSEITADRFMLIQERRSDANAPFERIFEIIATRVQR